jgi:hypothetical protein
MSRGQARQGFGHRSLAGTRKHGILRPWVWLLEERQFLLMRWRKREPMAAERVVRLPAGNTEQPGPRSGPPGKRRRARPDRQQRILEQFLSQTVVGGELDQVAHERSSDATVEDRERGTITRSDAQDQSCLLLIG